jgi:hypothetical protein
VQLDQAETSALVHATCASPMFPRSNGFIRDVLEMTISLT